ncbi:MAG: MFS transporter [Sediminibacterium sp.]|nr:MFS transporter [Sediminibacterium sp.]
MHQQEKKQGIGFVIGSSSLGTLIEWYDFYIFGMLATIISQKFFPEDSGTSALLSTLAIFAAGFIVRPFGALVFGRLGDIIGRKYTFLLTLILMGGSTFAIGLVPTYKAIGWLSPFIVLLLRLLQGLALGGEYGGAATYVAEHAPVGKRGLYTSWIQTTATIGLLLALGIILFFRGNTPESIAAFSTDWGGWRYPFWLSAILVIVSVIIRMKMHESPMFAKLKQEKKTSTNPLKESFGKKGNFKMVLLALFGATMGQGVIWYTGQFYAQSFLENVCKLDFAQSRNIIIYAIVFGTGFFIFFGWLSDKIGRKWIMLTGMLLGILSYTTIYKNIIKSTDAKYRYDMIDKDNSKLISKSAMLYAKNDKQILIVTKIDSVYTDKSVYKYTKTDTITLSESFNQKEASSICYTSINKKDSTKMDTTILPLKAMAGVISDPNLKASITGFTMSKKPNVVVAKTMGSDIMWHLVLLVFIQIIFVTMVYGPIAAFLVELFPTKIRYTSMSLPYHIGNGVFGGLVPFLGTLLVEMSKSSTSPAGDPLAGLQYPIFVASICFIIGLFFLNNKIDNNIKD